MDNREIVFKNLEMALTNDPGIIPVDEEVLNRVFTDDELKLLCNMECSVQMHERNLYYSFEKKAMKVLKYKDISTARERIYRRFQKHFSRLYKRYYVPWQKEYEEQRDYQLGLRRLYSILHLESLEDSDTSSIDSSESEVSTQTVIPNSNSNVLAKSLKISYSQITDGSNESRLLNYNDVSSDEECSNSPNGVSSFENFAHMADHNYMNSEPSIHAAGSQQLFGSQSTQSYNEFNEILTALGNVQQTTSTQNV